MCGITGFFLPGRPLDEHVLVRMNDTLRRRGPDDAGWFVEGPVGIAMRRLSIIDLGGGHQPIYNEDRSVVVVFNGELYNYRELRTALESRGHTFRTHSDTEVIVHLYEDHGADFACHIDGMFAVAVYDRHRQELHLARDRLGIKPLYVAEIPGGIVFGSEIKALLASGLVGEELDVESLRGFLRYTFVPGPRSIYRGIRQLPPASRLKLCAAGATESRYWALPAPNEQPLALEEAVDGTEARLAAAIESHLVSDVPVGAFLSGGLDSGLIAALTAGRLGVKLRTFTVRFPSLSGMMIDEVPTARTLVERYGLEHEVIDIEPDVLAVLPEAVSAFDEPFADDSIVPSYLIAQAAVRRVKVALTGLGGDELFAGYKRHLGVRLLERYARLPLALRKSVVPALVARLPGDPARHRWLEHLQRFAASSARTPGSAYDAYMSSVTDTTLAQLMPRFSGDANLNSMSALFDSLPARAGLLDGALRTDLQAYLPNDILALTDRTSMWHSLELRVPFLDTRLVEWGAALPESYKVRGRVQKYLLRKVAERWLPPAYLAQKKQGFESPMAHWLRGPLQGMWADARPSPSSALWEHLDAETVDRLWREHVSQRANHSKILFSLLMLFLWQRQSQPVR